MEIKFQNELEEPLPWKNYSSYSQNETSKWFQTFAKAIYREHQIGKCSYILDLASKPCGPPETEQTDEKCRALGGSWVVLGVKSAFEGRYFKLRSPLQSDGAVIWLCAAALAITRAEALTPINTFLAGALKSLTQYNATLPISRYKTFQSNAEDDEPVPLNEWPVYEGKTRKLKSCPIKNRN